MKSPTSHKQGLIAITLLLIVAVAFGASAPKLSAAFFIKGRVGLKWQITDNSTTYEIYRMSADGVEKVIGTTNEDHFFDTSIEPGTKYNYRIGIAGTDLISSARSVAVPESAGEFKAPEWIGSRVNPGRVMLNWKKVNGAIAYNVFRTEDPDGEYTVVGNTQSNRYADNDDIKKGATYYYILTALNGDFEETEKSEVLTVEIASPVAAVEEDPIELEELHYKMAMQIESGPNGRSLSQPSDVVLDSRGRIYVSDYQNAQVHCYDENGELQFTIGHKVHSIKSDGSPFGGLISPLALFVDARDFLFVSDVSRNDIQVFDTEGKFLRRIAVNTEQGMNPLRANGFAVLANGSMVMSDAGNHRLLVTDFSGKILKVIGERGAGDGQFNFPSDLVVTSDGQIVVVDIMNNRVQVLNQDGTFVRAFGSLGRNPGQFGRPSGIGLDENGNIWVSDIMSHLVQRFTIQGEVTAVLGSGQDEWDIATPRGLEFQGGRFYIVNRLPNRVDVLTGQ